MIPGCGAWVPPPQGPGRAIRAHPELGEVFARRLGSVIGELESKPRLREWHHQFGVPLPSQGTSVAGRAEPVPAQDPLRLAQRPSAQAEVAVEQTIWRGRTEAIGPAIEGMARTERRLKSPLSITATRSSRPSLSFDAARGEAKLRGAIGEPGRPLFLPLARRLEEQIDLTGVGQGVFPAPAQTLVAMP